MTNRYFFNATISERKFKEVTFTYRVMTFQYWVDLMGSTRRSRVAPFFDEIAKANRLVR